MLDPPLTGLLLRRRRILIVVVHGLLAALAFILAFELRFNFSLPHQEAVLLLRTLPLVLAIRLLSFIPFRLFQGLWRYVGVADLTSIVKGVSLGSLLFIASALTIVGSSFPRSVYALDWLLCLVFIGGARVMLRMWRERIAHKQVTAIGRRALIVGAGTAGELLMRQIRSSLILNYELVGMADDDPALHGRRIHGVRVLGGTERLPELVTSLAVEEILIAVPSADPDDRNRLLARCREAGVPVRSVPPLHDLLEGRAGIGQLREILPQNLIRREPVRVDQEHLLSNIKHKRVLVTGAGGSIGAELCRQLASFEPDSLVLFERAESSLYFIDLELRQRFPDLVVIPVIGDIRDEELVDETMRAHLPDIVYHAAAYKHVPLTEDHPVEAVRNNLFGTEVVARSAAGHGVERFVLISTDKAVRPVGVMGMTKRLAECVLTTFDTPTVFVSVRFGNVLGSAGSVLPLFQWQIMNGGPVTVTEPEATRYFMLIGEAVQLVLQAGAMARGGEIYFLDMGEPLKIMELANSMIHLSGLSPDRDMPIEVTGLRAGERLSEELVRETERFLESAHEHVFVVQGQAIEPRLFLHDLEPLRASVDQRHRGNTVELLTALTARYQ